MTARLVRSVALVALLVAVGAPIARADAGADAAAEAAIRRGVELRRAGKDQEALEEFRKAYAQARSPRALAQIGLAEQALGRWADAEGDLEEAMKNKGDPWIRKNATILSGAVEVIRRHLGSLEVIGPAGAELRIDGRVAGTLPLKKPARVPIGNLTVELRQEGFFPGTRPVSITAGELTRESIDLQPLPVAPPPPPKLPPGPASGPAAGGTAGGGSDLSGIPPPPQRLPDHDVDGAAETTGGRTWQRPLAWTTAVGALLGGAAGVTALVLRNGAVTDANNLMCNVGNGTVAPVDPANKGRCIDIADRGERWRVTALVSFSAAGALAIASAILFVTAPSSAAPATRTTALVCAPTLATAGVACHLRF